MNFKNGSASFRQRWSLGLNPDDEFKKFRQRVISALDLSGAGVLFTSVREAKESLQMVSGDPERRHIYQLVLATKDISQLAEVLQNIFWAIQRASLDDRTLFPEFARLLREAIDISPIASIEFAQRGSSVSIYPAGAKLLDDGVISEPLAWLAAFPDVSRHFEAALVIYLKKDMGQYRYLLDNLRKSLEELLRGVLNNDKSLENQKDVLLAWLRERGMHAQVSNMYQSLLFGQFSIYQNDAVKHGDAWHQNEVEFMLYLTATFMRLLLVLSNAAKNP
jgi:hypothetical protein